MKQLETLEAWKCSREIARAAYSLTLASPLNRHWGLADQIRRSAVSIPANLAEGYALGTTAQFIRCLRISLGSTAELRSHLAIARDVGLVRQTDVNTIIASCDREIKLLIGLLRRLGARTPR